MKATAKLVASFDPQAVLALGDDQYEDGTLEKFEQSYARFWGVPALKAITYPVPGNAEYADPAGEAAGYFAYFGSAAGPDDEGYYSYDLGPWHMIALNSDCAFIGGCYAGSAQATWLEQDLQSDDSLCTLAYFHHPLFSSGIAGSTFMRPIWDLLYRYGVDVVLNGHSHHYERFAPMDPSGQLDLAHGIREFIVGTGGKSHLSLDPANVQPNSETRDGDTYGVLYLWLQPAGYSWMFQPEPTKSFTDHGSDLCH